MLVYVTGYVNCAHVKDDSAVTSLMEQRITIITTTEFALSKFNNKITLNLLADCNQIILLIEKVKKA